MGSAAVTPQQDDYQIEPPAQQGASASSDDYAIEIPHDSQQQGPVNPYANPPSFISRAQSAVDEAAKAPPVDTSSVGGFASSVGHDLGAGATRLFFSPLAHPLQTAKGLVDLGSAAFGNSAAQYDVAQRMVEPFVRNPSGEAVAAIPGAALAATGLVGEAPAAEGAAVEEGGSAATGPARPTPPPAPPSGGGGPGNAPIQPQSGGGGGGGVATAVRTQVKLSPADQALADRMAAEKANVMPQDLKDLQARAAAAQKAAKDASFAVKMKLQAVEASRANGTVPDGPPLTMEEINNAKLLQAHADELSQQTQALTDKFRQGPAGWEKGPAGPVPPRAPSPAEVGAQYIARVKSGVPPAVAAAGLGMTPQHQEAVHVANALMPNTLGSTLPPAPPAAPAGPQAPQSPVALQSDAQQKTVAEAAASAQDINAKAADIAQGISPPKPPEVPLPVGMNEGQLTQDTVNHAGSIIMGLSASKRTPAILESVGSIAKWMLDSKTVIAPDGKVVNVDSPKTAQSEAVKIINAEIDRQNEQIQAKAKAQQDVQKERQENAQQAQEERDEAITPTETPKKSTGSAQPVEIPDTPAVQKARAALAAAPDDWTEEQRDALIRRTATVTKPVRDALVKEDTHRRANRQEDRAQAGMMGEAIPSGQSREELQRWTDAVKDGKHPFVHIPANVAFKPTGVEDLTRTPVKGAGPFSGTYYHPKEVEAADIRKAARDKKDPQAALDALVAKFKGEKPVELKAEDVEHQNPKKEGGRGKPEQPEAVKTSAAPVHEYGNTQVAIPQASEAAKALKAMRDDIPEDVLGAGGKEDHFHITLRYGIDNDDTTELSAFLSQQKPFEVMLGRLTTFPAGKDGVPLIVTAEARELRLLEKEIDKHGSFIDRTFPEYKPHATVAYIKDEKSAKILSGDQRALGKMFTVEAIEISKRDGTVETIKLSRTPAVSSEAPKTEQPENNPALTLPPEVATGLAAIVEEQAADDPTATLDSVLRDKDTGYHVAQALVNDGIITNSADDVNPKNALLTTSARAKVGDALLAELLPQEVIEQTPDFLKQKLLGSMGTIGIINSKDDEWNLKQPIRVAVENFNHHFRGEETSDPGPVVTAIVKALDAPLPAMRQMFSVYAIGADSIRDGYAPAGEPEKPFSAFNLAFGTELTAEQFTQGMKAHNKPTVAPPEVSVDAPDAQVTPSPKPLAKGDKVTYRTNKGKERTGEVAFTDGRIVRIKDGGSEVTKKVEEVKALEGPAPAQKPLKQTKAEAAQQEDERKLAEHFRPGNVILSDYWKEYDKVISFQPTTPEKGWSVTVIKSDKDGSPIPGERNRQHATRPDPRDRIVKEGPQIEGPAETGVQGIILPVGAGAVPEPAKQETLVDRIARRIQEGIHGEGGPRDYNGLRRLVEEFDGHPPDQLRMKEAQEAYETALNRAARKIVDLSREAKPVFDVLVDLYERQPNLGIRTSTSIANQAYSTPLPLAFVADRFAGITRNTKVYEPTAGNGALLIAANTKLTQANELDPARAQTLKDEGFSVTQNDATVWSPTQRVDAVVANPPFGPLAGPVKVDGYSVVKLDHLIIAKALGAMKDDGKACVILAAGDREKPGEITNQVRPFFNWLYARYNVVSDFELDGDLYSRQGASYPVRVIAIDGRVHSAKVSPMADAIQRLKTWEEVYGKAAEHLGPNLEGQRPANNVAGSPVRTESANQGAVSGTATGPNRPTDSGEPGASPAGVGVSGNVVRGGLGPVSHSGGVPVIAVGSTSATTRPDGDVALSDRLAEGQSAPRAVRRESSKPDGHSGNAVSLSVDAIQDESNQFQVGYQPRSEKKDVAVMAPKALIDPMQNAMDRIEEEVGDLDEFVTSELAYASVEEMQEVFMGIQVDAIAAAIYQMQRGKAIIIGDQTGVGKGRVGAAIIRWAELHGRTPIFVTEGATLFSNMYGDLQDIGSGQTITPLLFNADAFIIDPITEKKIFQNPGAMCPVLDRIRETGELPKGRNAVFLTYSQINKEDNRQQLTLQRIASNAIFVLDESHNAGGDSNTGNFLSELISASKGVTFMSATWAKRPDNLPLYAGMTDISIAIPDRAKVADAIRAGGAPLQAVLTSLLAQGGQFVRRERSFDGIEMKNKVVGRDEADRQRLKAEHTQISDQVTEILRAIVRADAMYHNIDFEKILAAAKKAGKSAASKGVVVKHMEFSSIVHNMTRQLLLGMKAQASADEIISAIGRGEKPIFALENTMGAFLQNYVEAQNLKEGDSLKGLDWSRIVDRALMRTRYYLEIDQMGNKTRIEVPLDDLSPAVRAAYDEAQRLVDALDIDLPVSPIDYIRDKVEKAGHKIAEITGRGYRVDYSGEVPRLGTVAGLERKNRVNTATQFNNGGLDALIINRAGSTGISLHASVKFRDQRQRHMIVGQPAGDVNIVMQILGRINRTGQVLLPLYTFLAVALPAEMRPAINLAKKMKSLNANVSSNTRAATSIEAVDLMNKYGDHIVAAYLLDNPEMARLLGTKVNTNDKGEATANEGEAMKATGHSALLPVSQQQEFMDSISEAYTNYIDFLDETGQNDLEPRTYDYAARELHTERMYQGTDETSPFGQDATYGEYSIKRQGKPFTPEEVMEKIADALGPEAMKLPAYQRDTLAARAIANHFEELYKPYYAGLKTDGAVERAQQIRTRGRQLLDEYRVGTGLRIEITGESYNGVVTNIEGAKKPSGNPYAPSSLQFTIAVNGGLRQTKVPGSQMDALVTSNLGRNADIRQLFKDYGTDRQKVKIITGNLLGAFGELKTGSKGRIISFTMEDGSSKLGIQMPAKFDIKNDVSGTYAMRSPEGALAFLKLGDMYLQSSGSEISVWGPSHRNPDWEIRTKTSKAASGKFFLDPKLLETVQGEDFASVNGLMRATVKEGRQLDALKFIMSKIALYAGTSHIEQARTIDEKAKAELDKPKPPRRASGSTTMSFLGSGALDPYMTRVLQPVVDYAKKAVVSTWKEATAAIRKTGRTGKQIGREVAAALAPEMLADSDALDIMGKALGEPALRLFEAGQFLHGVDQMFNKMSEEERIDFVDRWQTGKEQPTQDLEQAQEFMQEVMSQQRMREKVAINLGRKKSDQRELSDKSNYFPNRYKVAPGGEKTLTEDQQIVRLGQVSRRPFEGSKAFMKQQRYTLKQAVAEGAVPLGNPVEMLLRRLQEGAKFVAARYAWYNFKDQGLATFLKNGKKLPKDYAFVDDKSANVWRVVESIEGDTIPLKTGRWIIQKDAARLLNNYLSVDHIASSDTLNALVKIKNFSTEMKLAISAFHWAYITVENMASGLNTGMDKIVNQGIRGLDPTKVSAGLADIGKTIVAPYTAIKRGGEIIQYARNPDEFLESPEGKKFAERYPDFPHLMELLFAGGLRWNISKQFRESFGDHCLDAWKDGEIGKGIAKFLPWLSHGLMAPLFDHYIPRSKWAFAIELLSTKLAQYSYAIAMGEKTEEEIAREVAATTDNRFGELNWDSLYLNNDLKGAMQFFFRSATWAIGSWRGAYQAVKEQASSKMFDDKMFQHFDEQAKKGDWISQARRATSRLPQLGVNAGWILSMALLTSTLGSVTEKLATGKFPWDWARQDSQTNGMSEGANAAMEAMHPRTGAVDEHGEPVRVSWPTGLKDYEHGFESPGKYVKAKVSDVAVNAWNSMVQNRDAFGDYVYNPNDPLYKELWQGFKYNAVGDLTPMSADNWMRPYGPQDITSKAERFTGMIGGAPKNLDRSHALTEALERRAVSNPHNPMTPEQQAEREYLKDHPTVHSIRQAAREKNLTYLDRVFKELNYTDAKAVYDDPKTSPAERVELKPFLDRKRIDSIRNGRRK